MLGSTYVSIPRGHRRVRLIVITAVVADEIAALACSADRIEDGVLNVVVVAHHFLTLDCESKF
jgi:hypothetical protein